MLLRPRIFALPVLLQEKEGAGCALSGKRAFLACKKGEEAGCALSGKGTFLACAKKSLYRLHEMVFAPWVKKRLMNPTSNVEMHAAREGRARGG